VTTGESTPNIGAEIRRRSAAALAKINLAGAKACCERRGEEGGVSAVALAACRTLETRHLFLIAAEAPQ